VFRVLTRAELYCPLGGHGPSKNLKYIFLVYILVKNFKGFIKKIRICPPPPKKIQALKQCSKKKI